MSRSKTAAVRRSPIAIGDADPLTRYEESGTWPIVRASARILIVNDGGPKGAKLSSLIAAAGYESVTVTDESSALAMIQCWSPDLIIADLALPRLDGSALCRHVHALDPDLPVIVLATAERSELAVECLQAGAEDYLCVPLQLPAVSWCVQRALQRGAGKRERERLLQRTSELCEQLRSVNEQLLVSGLREHELAENEAQQRAELSALLEGLGEGIIILETTGQVRLVNAAARSILGTDDTTHDMPALRVCDVDGNLLPDEAHPMSRALRGDDYTEYEVVYILPNGKRRQVVTTSTSLKDTRGAVAVAIMVLRDITRLRELERQREEFTGLISHDLRTPLSVISMSAQLLDSAFAEKDFVAAAGCASRISGNARRMAVMLQELTEASRLEAQEAGLQLVPCDLHKLLVDIVARLDEARGRRVSIETAGAVWEPVPGDLAQLDRCITNLITNALKYSRAQAPVRVKLSDRSSYVEIAVTDHGIGIAPESLQHIFNRYFRTASGKGRAEGLGLGLYIARLIAEAHGGRIDVVSELGVGSTFTLRLPRPGC